MGRDWRARLAWLALRRHCTCGSSARRGGRALDRPDRRHGAGAACRRCRERPGDDAVPTPAGVGRRVIVQSTLGCQGAPHRRLTQLRIARHPDGAVGTAGRTVDRRHDAGVSSQARRSMSAATKLRAADPRPSDAPTALAAQCSRGSDRAARSAPRRGTAPPRNRDRAVPRRPRTSSGRRKSCSRCCGRYSRAYERLDVRATKALYPSIDDRRLQRAFQELEAQQVRFATCGVKISSSGAGANARCRGDATFRPKVGSRSCV